MDKPILFYKDDINNFQINENLKLILKNEGDSNQSLYIYFILLRLRIIKNQKILDIFKQRAPSLFII